MSDWRLTSSSRPWPRPSGEGRRIELRGFGTFSTRERRPRSTKNPRTGVVMDIPERKTLHFTMSKSLKEALISEKD